MARTNAAATRVKPERAELLTLHMLRRERVSPSFARVTLSGGDIARFAPLGSDQWFRLFLPVGDASLTRLPARLDALAYLRYLAISKNERPVLRNYTVRAFRSEGADGPELDVDFVIHGSAAAGTAGPAATWAQTCRPGDPVAILDEGIMFTPHDPDARVALVGDETAVPAAAGVLASLPSHARGVAVLEVPEAADRQELAAPDGVDVRWVVRADRGAVPGRAALRALAETPHPDAAFFGWAAGEQALASGARRWWVSQGVAKEAIRFCGYWKAGARH
jgi:NADPH-dependent ferric siderophore reductase